MIGYYFDWQSLSLETGDGLIEEGTAIRLSRGIIGALLVIKVVVGSLAYDCKAGIKARPPPSEVVNNSMDVVDLE